MVKSSKDFKHLILTMKLTFELMALLVNLTFKISALWFISQIQENANLWGEVDSVC